MFDSKRQRNLSYFVFGIYLVLLVWLVLFKFALRAEDIAHMRGVNLIPFYYDTEVNARVHGKEVFFNILIFVPLGVYLSIFFPDRRFLWTALPGFLLSLFFEVTQYVFAIGATDITDLIGNTAGTLLGVGLCALFRRILKSPAKKCQ